MFLIGNKLPFESVAAVSVQIDDAWELLCFNRKPKGTLKVVSSLICQLEVLPHDLLAFYRKQRLTKTLFAVRSSRWSKDVFP